MSQVISDYQLMKISSFIDGELEIKEIKELLSEMDKNPNLKDAYFKLFDLSLASKELTNTSIKKNIKNLSISSIISYLNQRIVLPLSVFFLGVFLSYTVVDRAINQEGYDEASALIVKATKSIEAKRTLENLQNNEILRFAARHYSPTQGGAAEITMPNGFKSDPSSKNRFINSAKRKEFSIFINLPRNSSLPDGEYKRENFVLLKKTYIHNNRAHSIAVFGDIDIDSGKKILNSIQIN
jgi:hypothetical protein